MDSSKKLTQFSTFGEEVYDTNDSENGKMSYADQQSIYNVFKRFGLTEDTSPFRCVDVPQSSCQHENLKVFDTCNDLSTADSAFDAGCTTDCSDDDHDETEIASQLQGQNLINTEYRQLKLLVSQFVAGSIIGHKGIGIKHIQQVHQVDIKLSEHKTFYPGTQDRIVYLKGCVKGVNEAIAYILSRLQIEAKSMNRDVDEQQIDLDLKMIIPHASAGQVIGKNGIQVNLIQNLTNAKVVILKTVQVPSQSKERVALIRGQMNCIQKAATHIVMKLPNSILSIPVSQNLDLPTSESSPNSEPNIWLSGHSRTGSLPLVDPFNAITDFQSMLMNKASVFEYVTCVFIELPCSDVGIVMGIEGRSIDEIQAKSGTRMQVSAVNDLVPGTLKRKLSVTGTLVGICSALCLIVERLKSKKGEDSPGLSGAELENRRRNLNFHMNWV